VKATEIRELNDDDLRQRLRERRDDLFALRFQYITGSVENVRAVRNAKRDIARINTIIRERELAKTRGKK